MEKYIKGLTTKEREEAKEFLRELYNIQTNIYTTNKDTITKGKKETGETEGN